MNMRQGERRDITRRGTKRGGMPALGTPVQRTDIPLQIYWWRRGMDIQQEGDGWK
jgi:hypothetical protein